MMEFLGGMFKELWTMMPSLMLCMLGGLIFGAAIAKDAGWPGVILGVGFIVWGNDFAWKSGSVHGQVEVLSEIVAASNRDATESAEISESEEVQ